MKISEDEWKKYRDIAPETIDDDRLKKLISNNNADPVLIAAAIENLWQGKKLTSINYTHVFQIDFDESTNILVFQIQLFNRPTSSRVFSMDVHFETKKGMF